MKLFKCLLFTLFIFKTTFSQTVVFHENMETVDSLSSNGNPPWFSNSAYSTSGNFSIRDTVAQSDSSYLTSTTFSTIGNTFVILSFNHICKLSFADGGTVEVSSNNGATWTQLLAAQYLGASTTFPSNNKFSSATYVPVWLPANDTILPSSSWWRAESFDISTLVGNTSQAKIRFKIKDGNNNGNSRNYGWLLDDVNVLASPSELFPPTITFNNPVYQGNIYSLGPFTISATITDNSGIQSATLYYTLNGGSQQTLAMSNTGGNNYAAIIPMASDSDIICYYVQAVDASPAANVGRLPSASCNSFTVSSGITFPFTDNFDGVNNLWTAVNAGGSSWELGLPAFGTTNSVHSAPNAWDIDLNAAYLDNTTAYLISPVFDFSSAFQPILSFWHNWNNETNWDGLRVDYSTNNGTSWLILGAFNDLNGVNWYNEANLNSSSQPGWSGNSTTLFGGWVQSSYNLSFLTGTIGAVRFRFVFTSDASVTRDGHSIDDFSISVPLANDAALDAIIAPNIASSIGDTVTVSVRIKNFGSNTLNSIPVSYNDGTQTTTETWSGTLSSGSSATYTFTTPFVVPSGVYNLCAWTSLAGDSQTANDSLCRQQLGISSISLPYTDNFEGINLWTDSSGVGSNWQLGFPSYGLTTGTHSGLNSWDVNLTTAYTDNARCYLTSPPFDFTGAINTKLKFWHRWNCEINFDGTRIEYTADNGLTWNTLGTFGDANATNWYNNPSLSTNGLPAWNGQSSGWVESRYSLSILNGAGNQVRFRLVFVSDGSVIQDGYSIDDFSLTLPSNLDAAIVSINNLLPTYNTSDTAQVSATVMNEGLDTLTAFDVVYTVNGSPTIYNWTGVLFPGDTTTIALQSFVVPGGQFNFCTYTSLIGDGDNTNDTICTSSFSTLVLSLPYFDSFDSINVWTDSSALGTNWQLGLPAFGVTNSTHSGANAWDVNLITAYADNALSYLTSPRFDFTSATNIKLSFWQNRNSEATWDGTRLEYSVNGGLSWILLGTVNDPNAINWYTDAQLNSSGLPAWEGNSSGWVRSQYNLAILNNAGPNVRFRFVFTSDGSIVTDGFSIDDFQLINPPQLDAAVISINNLAQVYSVGGTVAPNVTVGNRGGDTLTQFNIVYTVNGSPTTYNWTGTILPGANATVTLPTFVVPAGVFGFCAYTSLVGDGDHSNDTICRSSAGIQTFTLPYFTDFESTNHFYNPTNLAGTSDWEYGTPTSVIINSAYSPVNAWKTNLNGQYAANDDDYLYSPLFNFSGAYDVQLKFRHWYATATNDGGRLEYSTNSGASWAILGSVLDTNAANWYTNASLFGSGIPAWELNSNGYILSSYNLVAVGLDNYTGGLVQFRYNFKSTAINFSDGWAIDNFELAVNASPFDMKPITINNVNTPFNLPSNQTVTANITNRGITPINNVIASLYIDGTPVAIDTILFSPAINYGQVYTHAFSQQWNSTSGQHTVCVITAYPNGVQDSVVANDTLCLPVNISEYVLVDGANPNYCNDFDSGLPQYASMNPYTYDAGNSDFVVGTPAKAIINAAYSGANCWVTKLSGNYSDGDSSAFFTPIFGVDTVDCYEISFWHNFKTENIADGGTVEYSSDNGLTWNLIGFAGETDWYNANIIAGVYGPNKKGWSGNSNGWIYAVHNMKFTQASNVIFRFRFGSNFQINDEGWAIDNFCLKKVGPCVVGINEVKFDQAISIYPNPISEIFNVEVRDQKFNVSVFNALGELIYSSTDNKNSCSISARNWSNGVYTVKVQTDNNTYLDKIVKQ